MAEYGYKFELPEPDGYMSWSGRGFLARDIAEEAFRHLCEAWINDKLPDPPKRWQFWKKDIQRPDPTIHVFRII